MTKASFLGNVNCQCQHSKEQNKVVVEDVACGPLSEEVKVVFYSSNPVSWVGDYEGISWQ